MPSTRRLASFWSEHGLEDEDRVGYMESPLGQAMGFLAKALSESPLNDAKIAFATMQAGDYDEAVAEKKLEVEPVGSGRVVGR